ncbi:hypothetical protein JTB14_022078 [Gonioctena quinquepunctata]|nr:hypothetical protein JTB14_022078 [Gonioctena quinquepunctata]
MDDNEELPFRLVGMSREELNKELYADTPSDNESGNDSDDKDIDSEVSDEYIETPEIKLESDNDWDDEDLRPLSTFIDFPVHRQNPKWNTFYNVCKPTPFLEDSDPVNIINADIPKPCQLFEKGNWLTEIGILNLEIWSFCHLSSSSGLFKGWHRKVLNRRTSKDNIFQAYCKENITFIIWRCCYPCPAVYSTSPLCTFINLVTFVIPSDSPFPLITAALKRFAEDDVFEISAGPRPITND